MIKLDVGCGGRGTRHEGFIGIDIWSETGIKFNKEHYLRADWLDETSKVMVAKYEDDSVDEIIMLHFIEHLTRDEAIKAVAKAYKCLKPGGTITITVPDLQKLCAAYLMPEVSELQLTKKHLNGGKDIWPGETLADRLNWAIHQDTHKWQYDIISLIRMVEETGMVKIDIMEPGHKYNTRPDHEIGIIITKV